MRQGAERAGKVALRPENLLDRFRAIENFGADLVDRSERAVALVRQVDEQENFVRPVRRFGQMGRQRATENEGSVRRGHRAGDVVAGRADALFRQQFEVGSGVGGLLGPLGQLVERAVKRIDPVHRVAIAGACLDGANAVGRLQAQVLLAAQLPEVHIIVHQLESGDSLVVEILPEQLTGGAAGFEAAKVFHLLAHRRLFHRRDGQDRFRRARAFLLEDDLHALVFAFIPEDLDRLVPVGTDERLGGGQGRRL